MMIAGLIAFSIFLALALHLPFSGDVALSPVAFQTLTDSFEHRTERSRQVPCTAATGPGARP